MANVVCVVDGIGSNNPVIANPSLKLQLYLSFSMWSDDASGTVALRDSVSVARAVNSTAAQWKTDFLTALKAYATTQGHTITQLVGFVDMVSVANP